MSRSSSVPIRKSYTNDTYKLPKITQNSWLTNVSKDLNAKDIDYKKIYTSKNYAIKKRDLSNAMNNIHDNMNIRLNGKNPVIFDQINSIENNYYEMKNMLNNKINKLEQNQRKVNDFLKYSLEQDRIQNDINSYKFNKYIKNYHEKNLSEKDYLLNILNRVPNMIENKLSRIYLKEIEESRNQKLFLDNLKEKIALELQNQRRLDYLRYKRQLNEVIQLKNNEEREKLLLYHKIQKQKILNKMQAIKYQNQLYRYQVYNSYPFYQLMQMNMNNLNNNNNNNKQSSLGLNMDELIKILLFKEILGNSRMKDFQNIMGNYLLNPFMKPNMNLPYYGPRKSKYSNENRTNKADVYSNSKHSTKKISTDKLTHGSIKKSKTKTKKSENKTKSSKKKKTESSSDSGSSSSGSDSSSDDESDSGSKTEKESKKSGEEEKKSENKKEENTDDNKDDENDDNDGGEDDNNNDEDDDGDGDGDGEGDGEGAGAGAGAGTGEGAGVGAQAFVGNPQNQNINPGVYS